MGSAIGGEHMNCCRKWQKTLWLDVYGELPHQKHAEWKQHLENCVSCRQERKRMLQLLTDITKTMPEAVLTGKDAGVFHSNVMGKLSEQRKKKAWRRQSFFKEYIKPVYALAACSLMLAVFGWFGFKELHQTTRIGTISSLGTNEQMIAKDMDLLENLDLLEEMDTLKKLDQVMGKGKKAT
jgi:predicted anti-sigma-YlaC factor YlaD